MSIFQRNRDAGRPVSTQAGSETESTPLETQLQRLAEEEDRWLDLLESTTIETDVILGGLRGVRASRAALLEAQDQSSHQ